MVRAAARRVDQRAVVEICSESQCHAESAGIGDAGAQYALTAAVAGDVVEHQRRRRGAQVVDLRCCSDFLVPMRAVDVAQFAEAVDQRQPARRSVMSSVGWSWMSLRAAGVDEPR